MTTLQLILIAAFISLTILLAIGRTLYLRSVRVRNQLRLSQILTNIAHEMLTPLTILSASVEKLRSEQAETMHEEAGKAREGADRITEYDLMDLNIQRGVRLLQQILETSKSQAGELKLLVSNGDVMLFITETARCFLPLMHSKGLDFHIDCNPESMMGWMDTDKVDKILYNLLSNAAKYTPAGGQVRLEVRTNKHFDRIILQVSDTGQGISKEQMKHLFSRFFDGDYRYHKTFGTGLGLALTRDLVYLHKGTIKCVSKTNDTETGHGAVALDGSASNSTETNSGTTFTVEFPINKEAFAPAEIDERYQTHFNIPTQVIKEIPQATLGTIGNNNQDDNEWPDGASRVLIVEDNVELLMLMKQLLQRKYRILTASNGREALEVTQAHPLDLIVSDVMMPEMDGLELTTHVKHDQNYKHLPVLLLTAKIQEEDQQEALQAGADDIINKPFKLKDLLLHIDNLIANRQRIQSEPRPSQEDTTLEDIGTSDSLPSLDREFLERAYACVKEHIADSDYDRDTFAQDMGSSVSTLYNKIRTLTGMNVTTFIRDYRIKAACQMAKEEPGLRVSDIAYRVGYRDPKYFATSFKRVMGMQPKEYFAHIRGGEIRD